MVLQLLVDANDANDMLVGLHVPTDFQMYRQNYLKKALLGANYCPPPPSGYTSVNIDTIDIDIDIDTSHNIGLDDAHMHQ